MPNSKKSPAHSGKKTAKAEPKAKKAAKEKAADAAPHLANPWKNPDLVRYFGSVRARFGNLRVLQIATYKETRRDFHIDDLFVRPALTETHITLAEAESTPSFGHDLLAELQEHRRLVILGDPGSGKSTIINWIAWSLASTESHRPLNLAFKDHVPFPIVLREANVPDWDKRERPTLDSIFAVFLSQRFTEPLREQTSLLHDLFRRGQLFLLFDGIDELPASKREWLRFAWLTLVVEGRQQQAPAVLTSRIVGYDARGYEPLWHPGHRSAARLKSKPTRSAPISIADIGVVLEQIDSDFTEIFEEGVPLDVVHGLLAHRPLVRRYAAPFDQARIREYSRNWFGLRDRRAAEATAASFLGALEENPHLRELRHSPLLLTFMAIVYNVRRRLPDGRVLVYKEIVQAFLETIPLEKNLPVEFSPDTVREALALLAWEAQILRDLSEETDDEAASGILLPESVVRGSMHQALSRTMGERAGDSVVAALLDYCKNRTGLLIPRGVPKGKEEEHYAFAHLSFQEYLASQHLLLQLGNEWSRRQGRREGYTRADLHRLAGRENWRETFVLLFESMSEQVGALNPAAFAGYLFDARMAEEPYGFSQVDWTDEPEAAELVAPPMEATPETLEARHAEIQRLHLIVALMADTRIGFSEALRTSLLRAVAPLLSVAESVFDPHVALGRLRATPLASAILSSAVLREAFLTVLTELSKAGHLKELNLSGIQIADLTPFAGLSSLQQLNLYGTPVADLAPLSRLSALEYLNLDGTRVADITPLATLSVLQHLSFNNTEVSDLARLARLSSLQYLFFGSTKVVDLTPLAALPALKLLFLGSTDVDDLSPLLKITTLNFLYLPYTKVADLAPLSGLFGLKYIHVSNTKIADLTPLAGLSSLEYLSFGSTQVADLTPLAGLTSLQYLSFGSTQVADLTPLAGLSSLEHISLEGTPVANLGPLAELQKLRYLKLADTVAAKNKASIARLRKALPKCEILI